MTQQIKITKPCELLDENGHIILPGYATDLIWQYNRKKIKAPWYRIKEWDSYVVLCHEKGYGVLFTLADLGYLGSVAVCWLDFKKKAVKQIDTLKLFPRGKTNFASTSKEGDVAYESKNLTLQYKIKNQCRIITVDAPAFEGWNNEKGLKGEIVLQQDPKLESMVIASSWVENPKAFYYNQKINCMPASGNITLGKKNYSFNLDNSFGTLDWGRGNFTYKNQWYWGSASGRLNGESFGWNLGYGFSDRSSASENMLFYKGKAHKLEDVTFHYNPDNYMEPWVFTSNDGRFEMEMTPILDNNQNTDLKIIRAMQHQVFGNFNGTVILDDGTKLKVENFLGFGMYVLNWW